MRPCCFYTQIQDNIGFSCKYAIEHLYASGVPENKFDCPNFKYCQYYCDKKTIKKSQRYRLANCVVNMHSNGKIEIVKYNKRFAIPLISENSERGRNFYYDEEGDLFPKTKRGTVNKLENNLKSSSNRSNDNLYSYIQNNEWRYFITLTFSNSFVDKMNDDEIKYQFSLFRKKFQRFDKDVKILCVPERHESGCLHFHCLAWTSKDLPIVVGQAVETWNSDGSSNFPDSDQQYYMFPIFEDGKWKKSVYDKQFFALSFFDIGRNFTAIIGNDEQSICGNYISKYITKESNIAYNKRRFYCTHNLLKKRKFVAMMSDEDINGYSLEQFKEVDKFKVFRNFNIKAIEKKEGEEK